MYIYTLICNLQLSICIQFCVILFIYEVAKHRSYPSGGASQELPYMPRGRGGTSHVSLGSRGSQGQGVPLNQMSDDP